MTTIKTELERMERDAAKESNDAKEGDRENLTSAYLAGQALAYRNALVLLKADN